MKRIKQGDLYIKEVSINKTENEGSTISEKRRYIFVYNPDREKQDLEELERKIKVVKNILVEQLGKEEAIMKLGNLKFLLLFKGDEMKM